MKYTKFSELGHGLFADEVAKCGLSVLPFPYLRFESLCARFPLISNRYCTLYTLDLGPW